MRTWTSSREFTATPATSGSGPSILSAHGSATSYRNEPAPTCTTHPPRRQDRLHLELQRYAVATSVRRAAARRRSPAAARGGSSGVGRRCGSWPPRRRPVIHRCGICGNAATSSRRRGRSCSEKRCWRLSVHPLIAAAPGTVLELVIEHKHVARSRLDGIGGHLAAGDTPELVRSAGHRERHSLMQGSCERIAAPRAARDHPQAARVPRHRVEVEGDLERRDRIQRAPCRSAIWYRRRSSCRRCSRSCSHARARRSRPRRSGVVQQPTEVSRSESMKGMSIDRWTWSCVRPLLAQTSSNASVMSLISVANSPWNFRKPNVR